MPNRKILHILEYELKKVGYKNLDEKFMRYLVY